MALARTFSPSFSSCLLLQFFFVVGSSAGDVLSDAGNGMVSFGRRCLVFQQQWVRNSEFAVVRAE